MNRIKEYLENLDNKNLIMLYLSVLILFIIIGYFVYQKIIFPKKQQLINQKISLITKIREVKSNNYEIIKLRKIEKNKKLEINSLREDLNYLNALIYSAPKININKKRYLTLIDNYLKIGSNLNASFKFNQTKKINKYNIYISGKFLPEEYFTFVKFLKILQNQKVIVTINSLNLDYEKYVNYDINLSIWSIK